MWSGLLCDCCEKRIASIWIHAVVGVPADKRTEDSPTVEVTQELCDRCLKQIEPRIVDLLAWVTYTAYGGGGTVKQGDEGARKNKR